MCGFGVHRLSELQLEQLVRILRRRARVTAWACLKHGTTQQIGRSWGFQLELLEQLAHPYREALIHRFDKLGVRKVTTATMAATTRAHRISVGKEVVRVLSKDAVVKEYFQIHKKFTCGPEVACEESIKNNLAP